jgi:hypothetical protein
MPHSVATEFFPSLIHAWPASKDKHQASQFMTAHHDASAARPRLHLPQPPYSLALPALPLSTTSGPVTPPSDMKLPRHTMALEAYPMGTTATFDEGYMSSSNPKPYAYPAVGQMRSSARSNGSPAKPAVENAWQSPSKVLAANPGLKIPHTVPAPQADLPELTADVSIAQCGYWWPHCIRLESFMCLRVRLLVSSGSNMDRSKTSVPTLFA